MAIDSGQTIPEQARQGTPERLRPLRTESPGSWLSFSLLTWVLRVRYGLDIQPTAY